jgi:hypothetical protein
MAVTLGDDLGIEELPVRQEHVPEQAPVLVPVLVLRLVLEAVDLPEGHAAREGRRLLAEGFDGLLGVDGLGSIDPDEPDLLDASGELNFDRVAIDHIDDGSSLGGPGERAEQH